jgi:SAM-dependent methyltransferase
MDQDWAERWRALQAARAREPGPAQRDFWDRRAPGFALVPRPERPTFFQELLEPWIEPGRTLIDVGAGLGGLAAELAGRLKHVTAVEPSPGMNRRIPSRPNLTVVPTVWQHAEVDQADLVICVHVLYGVADPVPFIDKLQAKAAEHVFIVMRDSAHTHPGERLAPPGRPVPPRLRDCFLLLRQLGVTPDLAMFTTPTHYYFADLDAAVEECRLNVGPGLDERAARTWLASNLQPGPGGTLVYDGGDLISGVLHWNPQSPRRDG